MRQPNQLLLLLPGAFGPAGGIEMYGRLLCKAASDYSAAMGARVTTLILNDRQSDLDDRYYRKSDVVRGFARSKASFISAALRAATTSNPDLIVVGHVNFAPLGMVLGLVRPRSRIWYLTYGIDFWRRLRSLHRRALARAARILSISDYTRMTGARVNGLSEEKIDLLPCAIDPFWPGLQAPDVRRESNHSILLSVARLAPSERYKGIDDVIRALPRIRAAVPDVRYVIVGDGGDRDRLLAIAKEEGVADALELKGRVPPEDLYQAYRDADVFVMPSAKEGFGIVFLEAAAFSKPSIAARSGGAPEVVLDGDTGLLVDFGDVPAIANSAIELLQNKTLRDEMGGNARRRLLSHFTFTTFSERFAALAADAVAERSAAARHVAEQRTL